jgi:hypothetical protein
VRRNPVMREATVPIAIVRVSRARPRGLAVVSFDWSIPDRLQTTDGRSCQRSTSRVQPERRKRNGLRVHVGRVPQLGLALTRSSFGDGLLRVITSLRPADVVDCTTEVKQSIPHVRMVIAQGPDKLVESRFE